MIPYDTGRWRRLLRRGNIFAYLRETLALRRRLQALQPDVVINLHADKWWSAWFNAAKERVGVFYNPTIGRLGVLYTKSVAQPQQPKRLHNSEHYLKAVAEIGIEPPYDLRMLYQVSETDRFELSRFLEKRLDRHPNRPLLVIHPGTSRASKNWLPDQYAELIQICDRYDVVITGSVSERDLAARIAKCAGRADVAVAAGELNSFGAVAALIEIADVVVTGDTAALHLASALGTPLVGIYGSTRPRSNAPLFGESQLLFDDDVPCAPCYRPNCPLVGDARMACMKAVTPAEVAAAVERIAALKSPNSEANPQERPT